MLMFMFQKDINLADAKLAICEVLSIHANYIWDGDAVAVGEMLDDGVPDLWAGNPPAN